MIKQRTQRFSMNLKANNDCQISLPALVVVTLMLSCGETAAFTQPKHAMLVHPGPTLEFSHMTGPNSRGVAGKREHLRASRLFYRSGIDDGAGSGIDHKAHNKAAKSVRSKLSNWWSSTVAPPQKMSDVSLSRQAEVDRYLEFLDKRYHRLNDEPKNESNDEQKKFNMLEWLSTDSSHPAEQIQKDEDALYVLGVAGLASKQLLIKHHLIEGKSRRGEAKVEEDSAVVIDTEATSDATIAKVAVVSSIMLRRLAERRRAFISYQNQQFRKALRLSAEAMIKAPMRAAKAVWEIGGGKRTFALTVAVLTATFFLARPVVATLIKSTMYQNPVVA